MPALKAKGHSALTLRVINKVVLIFNISKDPILCFKILLGFNFLYFDFGLYAFILKCIDYITT